MDKYKTRVLASVHEAISDLHSVGAVSSETMQHFDQLCLDGQKDVPGCSGQSHCVPPQEETALPDQQISDWQPHDCK